MSVYLNPNFPAKKLRRYFEYLPDKAKCLSCQKEVSRKDGTTTSMRRHLKTSHKKLFKKYCDGPSSNVEQNPAELYTYLDTAQPGNELERYFEYLYNPDKAKCRNCQ